MLCRVFHKTKSAESSSFKLSPQYVFDTTAGSSSPPPDHDQYQTLSSCGYQQIPSFSTTQPHQNIPVTNPNLLHFSSSQEMNTNTNAANQIKGGGGGGDEYGFLWDMSCSLGDGVVTSSNLEDMRFDDSNSLVFL